MSAEELMEKAAVSSVPVYNIDGYFMMEQPYDVYAKGSQVKVPLLVGGNSNEMVTGFLLQGKPATLENIKASVKPDFGDATDEIVKMYGIDSDAA